MTRVLDLVLRAAVELVMLIAAPVVVATEWVRRARQRPDDDDDQAEQAM
ncbi:hypothetical protein FHU38_000985 [Saccharomonospora amisosensis]|uniref:Uncharacterized protein n=1 Tax=Saccharomonospora amisosensis TaxID=1128677 RepID=A0A7X5UMA4_9PSEU|nr:hypothetical protein [Saccharomonospora amisosensis]NIJ10641.1 hypothetical protein [Saccharomonospora amisosensis]